MSRTSSDHADEHGSPVELTESERHRLLAHEDRRAALAVLSRRATPMSLAELAARIAESDETAASEDDLTARLHHRHLPRMADLGVVDYDPSSNRVEACRVPTDLG